MNPQKGFKVFNILAMNSIAHLGSVLQETPLKFLPGERFHTSHSPLEENVNQGFPMYDAEYVRCSLFVASEGLSFHLGSWFGLLENSNFLFLETCDCDWRIHTPGYISASNAMRTWKFTGGVAEREEANPECPQSREPPMLASPGENVGGIVHKGTYLRVSFPQYSCSISLDISSRVWNTRNPSIFSVTFLCFVSNFHFKPSNKP